MKDRSGNGLATTRFKLNTFRPRVAGLFAAETAAGGQKIELKDVEILRKRVGTTLKTYVVATADAGLSPSYRLLTLDVTEPDNILRLGDAIGGSGKKRLVMLTDLGTPDHPAMPFRTVAPPVAEATDCDGTTPMTSFTGDLAVATSWNTLFSYLSFFNVKDVNHPCLLANKLLTATPDTLSDFSVKGTVHALGFAYNVATIQHSLGYAAYAAVGEVGIFAADIGKDVPEFLPAARTKEGVYSGDYRDIVNVSDKLLAANRGDSKLEVFDPNLSLLGSVDLPAPPRRIVTVSGYGVDKNEDGLIAPDEQFDLAFVAVDDFQTSTYAVEIVDITDLQDMHVIGEIPMPGIIRELAVDPVKHRLFAGGGDKLPTGAPPGTVVGDGLYMLDLSNPFRTGLIDADSDGYDDRMIWRTAYANGINGFRLDQNRGLLYAGSVKGLDIWSVYDACCDLGVDMTAKPADRQTGDRTSLLLKEKKALQQEISAGIQSAVASCGLSVSSIAILEQGSGACLWKSNPARDCSDTYQPGLSDHDYEVYFPAGSSTIQQCVVDELNKRFTDPVTKKPKEIPIDNSTIVFEDITFFPFSREDFEHAKLNLLPPASTSGDTIGDLGLGRQQLLLLWLLGGEYVQLPAVSGISPGRSLDDILKDLKNVTGIPRLEGHEWATLQRFNLAKSKAFLRFKGASDAASSLHELYIKQLHDAAKAGIRTAFARLVADTEGNKRAKNVTRASYTSNACLAVNEAVTDPNEWLEKPCTSFEEYAASAIARTLRRPSPLTIFTLPEVFKIHRFYRVKADVERILSEADADQFIAGIAQFIDQARTITEPIYQQELATDPNKPQRDTNLTVAVQKRNDALVDVTVPLNPHVFNHGFHNAEAVEMRMYSADTPGSGTLLQPPTPVDLAGGDERFFDFKRSPDGEIVLDSHGKPQPLFELPPVTLNQNLGIPKGISFTIDLPGRKMKEAVRENNVGGFFYYVLDPNNPVPPSTPGTPNVPFSDPDVLKPSPECDDAPALRISQSIVTAAGTASSDEVDLALGETVTIRLTVANLSGDAQTDVMVCSNVTNQCYNAGNLAVGQVKTIDVPYTAPDVGRYIDGTPTAYSTESGIIAGAATRVMASCEPYRVIEPEKNPNPSPSEAMLGGHAYRYYKVVNKRTGVPKVNASVKVDLTGFFGGGSTSTQTLSFHTNADGQITDATNFGPGVVPGMPIEITPQMVTGTSYFGRIASIDGVEPSCQAPVEFTLDAKDREFSRTYSRGAGIEGSIGLIAGMEASGEAGLELEKEEKYSTGIQKLNLTETAQTTVKLGVEFSTPKLKFQLGPAKGKVGGEIGVSETKLSGTATKYEFPYPLNDTDSCAIATITLEKFAGLSPFLVKLLNLVRSQPCGDPSPYLKSIASTFGREATASASLKITAGLPLSSNASPTDKVLGINFGATGSSGYGVETSYKTSYAGAATVTGTSQQYKLKGGLDFNAGLTVNPTDPPKDQEEEKTTIESRKRGLKTSISATTAESYSVGFGFDFTKPLPEDSYPSSVTISYSPPKGFGWKRDVNGTEHNIVGGVGRTFTYTIDNKDDVKKVVDGLANLDQIRQSNIGAGVLSQIVLAPTVLNDEMDKFDDLLRQIDMVPYSSNESTGSGSESGLAIEGSLGPVKLGGGVLVKSDHAVSYDVEKGVVVKGATYVLEEYTKDAYIPNADLGLGDLIKTTWNALLGSFLITDISEVARDVTAATVTQLKSPFTATMNINGALEPAEFRAGLTSWRWTPEPGPVGNFRILPSDTTGPAGSPHYGTGAFHQFLPENYHLAVPTALVIDYQDPEVAGIDESKLAIYAWNPTAADWDFIGGTVNAAANTVTATVDTFRLYTVAPAMPARDIALTFISPGVVGTGPTATQSFTATSGPLVMNNGQPVPDGTLYTVRSVAPGSSELNDYGTVLTVDEDPTKDGVQVSSQGGVIHFEIQYPAPDGFYIPGHVAVYSKEGTAFGQADAK